MCLLQNDDDSLAGDTVFFDPNDSWKQESNRNTRIDFTHETRTTATDISVNDVVPDVIDVGSNKNKPVKENAQSPQEMAPKDRLVQSYITFFFAQTSY